MLDSPYRLFMLSVAGTMLASSGFLLGGSLHGHHTPVILELVPCCLIAGLALLYWAPSALKDAVLQERWPPERLAPLLRMAQRSAWKWLRVALLVTMVAALFTLGHNKGLFWAIFCLLQAQTGLTNALTPPRQRVSSGRRLDWSSVPPLQSEHWGER